MNTHFCKVGAIRSRMDFDEESLEIENNTIESKSEKTKSNSKSE